MISQPATYIKAILATATAIVGSLTTAVTDGSLTWAESLTAVGAGLAALTLVYRIPNADA